VFKISFGGEKSSALWSDRFMIVCFINLRFICSKYHCLPYRGARFIPCLLWRDP